jgi:hypothetical protein
MESPDKKTYITIEKSKTSYLAIFTTIVLVITLIYLILVAYLFSRISSGHFDAGSYYNAIFWMTIILIMVLTVLLGYSAYKTFTGDKASTKKEIDRSAPSQKELTQKPPPSQRVLTEKQLTEKRDLEAKQQKDRDTLARQHAQERSSLPYGTPTYSANQLRAISQASVGME